MISNIDYTFPTKCEDCSDRAASVVWENWCNGYIVSRFRCASCLYEWDDIWIDKLEINCEDERARV